MNGSHHITKDGYYSTNCLEELCHCKIKLLKISFCWGYLAISTSKINLNNKLKKMALLEWRTVLGNSNDMEHIMMTTHWLTIKKIFHWSVCSKPWEYFYLLCMIRSKKKMTLYTLTLVCKFSIQLSGYISHGADKENLSNNQELHYLVFISIILKTLTKDSAGILRGEISCWSLLWVIKRVMLIKTYNKKFCCISWPVNHN